MSGEKPAPTAAEIADARRHLSGPIFDADRYVKVQASIRTLLAALDAAEARADTAENAGARLLLDLGKAKERAETAERERDEARAALKPGAIVVSDTPETRERLARVIYGEYEGQCTRAGFTALPMDEMRNKIDPLTGYILAALRESRP